MKLGSVSGNDPNSVNKYEGYLFNRNYDVAMLLFNYGLGQGDMLGTGSFRSLDANQDVDNEYLSNTFYIAPGMDWKWTDTTGLNARFIYAMLGRAQFTGQSSNLGMELDLGAYYKPHDRLTVHLDAGVLFPGAAFEGGASNFPTQTAYGVMTKAAVSF